MAKVLGVGDHSDLDDLAARDRELEDEDMLPTPGHSAHGFVHQRWLYSPDAPGELLGHGSCPANFAWRAPGHGGMVGPQDHIRIQQREQRVEIPLARSLEEGFDHCSASWIIRFFSSPGLPHSAACTARQL